MTDVRLEQTELDQDVPMMYRDFGAYIRLAHDPRQITEASALAILCLRIPRLVGAMNIRRD